MWRCRIGTGCSCPPVQWAKNNDRLVGRSALDGWSSVVHFGICCDWSCFLGHIGWDGNGGYRCGVHMEILAKNEKCCSPICSPRKYSFSYVCAELYRVVCSDDLLDGRHRGGIPLSCPSRWSGLCQGRPHCFSSTVYHDIGFPIVRLGYRTVWGVEDVWSIQPTH